MQSKETGEIAAYLADVAARKKSAQGVAEAVDTTLKGIEQVLTPIVGLRGVAALYKRALHLARGTHAWLPEVPTGTSTAMDPAPLAAALARQSEADAAAAGARLLREFHDLLVTLIGHSLTERLLRSVWATFLSDSSAQDNKQ